jgi:hypothetical protein
MKASAAFETKAWRTDAEGRCCKDRRIQNRYGQNRHGGHLQPDVSPLLGKMPGKPEARQGIRPELSLYGDERLTELIRRAWPRCLTWPWVVVQE